MSGGRRRWALAGGVAAVAVVVVVAVLSAASRDRPRGLAATVGEAGLRVASTDAGAWVGCVLTADTGVQHSTGLMGVTDLGRYDGMIFRYDEDVSHGFWMKGTPLPLSIAWFDGSGSFVSATDMTPCVDQADRCPSYPPGGPYRTALEVPQGGLDDLGVGPGSRIEVLNACR